MCILSRAILPEIVKFAYIPRADLQIHGDSQAKSKKRSRSPDYSAFDSSLGTSASGSRITDDEEHVLVLDFVDNARGTKPSNMGYETAKFFLYCILTRINQVCSCFTSYADSSCG